MEAQSTYPKYRISAAYQRGRQLTAQQRTSSTFDPEPRIGPWSFRPGQKPVEITEEQFQAASWQLKNAVKAGSIVVEVMPNEMGNWIKLGSDAAPVDQIQEPVITKPVAEVVETVAVTEEPKAEAVTTVTAVTTDLGESAPVETKKKKGKA